MNTTIDQELLKTIKGVQVECWGRVPESYTSELERFIANWVYESDSILIESWRIEQEIEADPEISNAEAQRLAVVNLGHLEFLKTLENDNLAYDSVCVSPIS
tara:strand:- start:542 stop:847 length:306 start_codon:yes stop_codon:yes gene_type:complete